MSDSFFEYNNKMFYKGQDTVEIEIFCHINTRRDRYSRLIMRYIGWKNNHAIGDLNAIQLYIRNEIHIYFLI